MQPIAPSTYYEHKARQSGPGRPTPRVKRDAHPRPGIQRVLDADFQVHGARKVWLQLNREPGARRTVERLRRATGPTGAVRGKKFKTATPDVMKLSGQPTW